MEENLPVFGDKTSVKEYGKGKSYCLRLLALRSRTEREISDRLGEKGYSEDIRESLVEALKKKGLIDDTRFACEWIRQRLEENPRSRKLMEEELRSKGISEEVLSESMLSADIPSEIELALLLIDKRSGGKVPDEKTKIRLFRFLLGKGFDVEIAEEAIRKKCD